MSIRQGRAGGLPEPPQPPAILLVDSGSRCQIRQPADIRHQITARRKVSDIAIVGGIGEIYGGERINTAQNAESAALHYLQYRATAKSSGLLAQHLPADIPD